MGTPDMHPAYNSIRKSLEFAVFYCGSCIFHISVVSEKSRDDNLCCLPYLALIPCYGYERVSEHLHQFEPSPKVPAPGAQPLLIILTRTQHYNSSCHGSGKDQAGFSSTITTDNHLKEILMLINSPLIEYWVVLELSQSIFGWFTNAAHGGLMQKCSVLTDAVWCGCCWGNASGGVCT